MGSRAGNFLMVFLKNFDVLAGPVISLVYPLYVGAVVILLLLGLSLVNWAVNTLILVECHYYWHIYASVRAIESKSPVDDQQWLTYWVLCSLITLFELTFAKLLEWIPIWPYAKLTVTCWLVLPYFNGAAYVYEHYVRPFLVNPQTINIWYVPKKKDTFAKPDDILTAAEKYIQENGTQAFENLIHRADKSRGGGYNTMYDETY